MGKLNRIRPVKISLLEVVTMAVEALWSNRLRTSLTMLGVIVGIASVITVTSVGQGVQKATEKQIQSLGTNVMLVLAGIARSGGIGQGFGSASTLTWEDAQAVAKQVPAAEAVTAFLQRNGQVVYGENNTSTFILGVDLNYPTVKEIYPQQGQFFVKSLSVIGNENRRYAQCLAGGAFDYESRAGRVPGRVTAGFERGADAPRRKARRVRLSLDKLAA